MLSSPLRTSLKHPISLLKVQNMKTAPSLHKYSWPWVFQIEQEAGCVQLSEMTSLKKSVAKNLFSSGFRSEVVEISILTQEISSH